MRTLTKNLRKLTNSCEKEIIRARKRSWKLKEIDK